MNTLGSLPQASTELLPSMPPLHHTRGSFVNDLFKPVPLSGRSSSLRLSAAVAAALWAAAPAWAATYTVTSNLDDGSAGTLRYAINQANANPGSTINFAANLFTIGLTSPLPNINANMTINGDGNSISGSGAYRIFFVNSGTVGISNLLLQGGVAQGGNGGSGTGGGGGGMGAGGAIFIRGNDGGRTAPTVTLSNLNLINNKAVGGTGGGIVSGSVAGGGGGGLGGNGGNGQNYAGGGGGGYPPARMAIQRHHFNRVQRQSARPW